MIFTQGVIMKYSSLCVLILLVVTGINVNGKNTAKLKGQRLMPTMLMSMQKSKPIDWSFLPKVIAEIDGKKISKQELINFFHEQMKLHSSQMRLTEQQVKAIVPQLLEELLIQKLLTPLAIKAGFKPSPKLVKNILNTEYKNMSTEQQAWKTRQLAFDGTTLARSIKKQAANQVIQNKLAINEWVKSKTRVPAPSQAEIKEFYLKNRDNQSINKILHLRMSGDPVGSIRASHILIEAKADDKGKVAKADDELAKAKAETILAKLNKGENFEALAQLNSDCSSSERGGSLGAFGKGSMVKEFETATKALKPGEMSGLVKTKFGYHIIRRDQAAETKYFPYDTVKEKIAEHLLDRRINSNSTQKNRTTFLKTNLDQAKVTHNVKLFIKVQK